MTSSQNTRRLIHIRSKDTSSFVAKFGLKDHAVIMSSRALRKAQREREEQEARSKTSQADPEESDGDERPSQVVQKSAFALLGGFEDEGDEDSEDGPQGDAEDGGVSIPADQSQVVSRPTPKKKKKKKKKKQKEQDGSGQEKSANSKSNDPRTEDMDEIDLALKQLSATGDAHISGATVVGQKDGTNEACKLLAIDTGHLHAQNEMRRLFGRAALEDRDEDQPPPNANIGGNRRQQRRVQQMGLAQALRGQAGAGGRTSGLTAMALRRNIFVQGKEEWPPAAGGGIAMEVVEKRNDDTRLYKFVHHRVYQDVQAQFQVAVESMDPQQLVVLLQHNPYHISTLLQVSEIAKQDRDPATAGDLLERALFALGRGVHSTFAKALSEGKARLDFRAMENRELWLASWRYMQNLTMRATWRTVYEWAKFLLSLSPEEDPYAIWLVLDQYALRSKQDLDYLNVSRSPAFKRVYNNMPNVQLSQGLAEFRSGSAPKGRQALYTAIGRFPWVVARLMQELQLTPPPGIWGKEPRTPKEKLYTELYATRAKDLWNTPEATELLLEIASALPPDLPSAEINNDDITTNEARHILLSDTPALISLIPRHFTAQFLSSSDPLAPPDSHQTYLSTLPSQSSRATNRRTNATPAENLSELHGLYVWFRSVFTSSALPDDADETIADTDTMAEVQRLMSEAGVPHEVFVERTRRFSELHRLLGVERRDDAQVDALMDEIENMGADDEAMGEQREEGDRRARVEDATDEESD